jgi:hypothetical protein
MGNAKQRQFCVAERSWKRTSVPGGMHSRIPTGQFGLANPGRRVTIEALECVIIGAEIAEKKWLVDSID